MLVSSSVFIITDIWNDLASLKTMMGRFRKDNHRAHNLPIVPIQDREAPFVLGQYVLFLLVTNKTRTQQQQSRLFIIVT